MLREFREFLNRGSVIDLAVAVIIGTAFGAIVSSLVNDIIMPLIGVILGGVDFSALAITFGNAQILYGKFIQAIINFLIIAWVVFMILRVYNRFKRKEVVEAVIVAPPEELLVLREIRDLLRRQGGVPPTAPRV